VVELAVAAAVDIVYSIAAGHMFVVHIAEAVADTEHTAGVEHKAPAAAAAAAEDKHTESAAVDTGLGGIAAATVVDTAVDTADGTVAVDQAGHTGSSVRHIVSAVLVPVVLVLALELAEPQVGDIAEDTGSKTVVDIVEQAVDKPYSSVEQEQDQGQQPLQECEPWWEEQQQPQGQPQGQLSLYRAELVFAKASDIL
jgi:hypothetical protein